MTLEEITARLSSAGVPDARFDALCILEKYTGRSRAALLAERGADLDAPGLEDAVRRREGREPLQYILGEWEFMGCRFALSPACLIPRADTELLCSVAAEETPRGGKLLDMCTGSGCVAISVARLRPDVTAVGADLFPGAISTAVENARLNGVADRVSFVLHDVRDPWRTEGEFDCAAANPPYLTADEMASAQPELLFEPKAALTDGGDGLSLIRAFVTLAKRAVKRGGIIATEHGSEQEDGVKTIFREAGLEPATLLDTERRPRVTRARNI